MKVFLFKREREGVVRVVRVRVRHTHTIRCEPQSCEGECRRHHSRGRKREREDGSSDDNAEEEEWSGEWRQDEACGKSESTQEE